MAAKTKYLKKIYLDPKEESSFSGVTNLMRRIKKDQKNISKQEVEDFLTQQTAYTLHFPRRLRFPRAKIRVYGLYVTVLYLYSF